MKKVILLLAVTFFYNVTVKAQGDWESFYN